MAAVSAYMTALTERGLDAGKAAGSIRLAFSRAAIS
jgi:hypothetical protein